MRLELKSKKCKKQREKLQNSSHLCSPKMGLTFDSWSLCSSASSSVKATRFNKPSQYVLRIKGRVLLHKTPLYFIQRNWKGNISATHCRMIRFYTPKKLVMIRFMWIQCMHVMLDPANNCHTLYLMVILIFSHTHVKCDRKTKKLSLSIKTAILKKQNERKKRQRMLNWCHFDLKVKA